MIMSFTIRSYVLRTFAVLSLLLATVLLHAQCGEERWEVKTLQDDEADQIKWRSKASTVHEQLQFPKPAYHDDNPRDPTELQVYRIDCILLTYVEEDDGDWHLVIKDLRTNEKMTVEVPDPACPEITHPKLSKLALLRRRIVAQVGPVKQRHRAAAPGTRMRVWGVGFFDKKNHPVGFSGRELHPVINLTFPTN